MAEYTETLKLSGISEGGISYYCMTKDLQKVAWRRSVNLQVFEGMHKVEFDCKYYNPEKYVEFPRVWIGDIVLDSIKKIS